MKKNKFDNHSPLKMKDPNTEDLLNQNKLTLKILTLQTNKWKSLDPSNQNHHYSIKYLMNIQRNNYHYNPYSHIHQTIPIVHLNYNMAEWDNHDLLVGNNLDFVMMDS